MLFSSGLAWVVRHLTRFSFTSFAPHILIIIVICLLVCVVGCASYGVLRVARVGVLFIYELVRLCILVHALM